MRNRTFVRKIYVPERENRQETLKLRGIAASRESERDVMTDESDREKEQLRGEIRYTHSN